MKNLSLPFLCLFILTNSQLQGMDKPEPISKSFAHFLKKNQNLSDNDKAKEALRLLENTDSSINEQNSRGNTIAHLLAPIAIEDRVLLVKIFNIFIKRGLDPKILNNKGKTAQIVALDEYSQNRNYCYASNANIFHRLAMGTSLNDEFVLHSDMMTISVKSCL